MAQEETVQGAAKKISGLLNPEAGQSAPEKKAEPSEQPQEIKEETSKESQPTSEGTPKEEVLKIPKSKKKRKQK